MKKKNIIILIILIILVEQLMKFCIFNTIKIGNSINFIGTIIRLTNVKNTGGAFSIGKNDTNLIILVNSVIIIIFLIYFLKNYNKIKNVIKIAITLIMAGGISNLIDRIKFGYVIDYIDINNLIKYPIFNVEDILIVIGIILMIICILRESIKKQENE